MKMRALAAAIAAAVAVAVVVIVGMIVAGSGSSVPAASHPEVAVGGALSYWTPSRLLAARAEQRYPLGKPANSHPVRCVPGSAGCLPAGLAVRVGAIFYHDAAGGHYCTASVVASPGRDLLITAAHCINSGKYGGGYRQGIVFIPDYRDGQAPFGIWTPARMLVAPQWISSSDPNLDVGFVVLNTRDGENIQQVLRADRLGIDFGYRNLVQVTGYPGSGGAPVTCVNQTSRQSATQLRFDCGGYTDGTSGSPWVTNFNARTASGVIVGVLGGYQQGGDTPAISYSSYLGSEVHKLYLQAVADEPSSAG
jgi:V8-like Glu-specific endopeptidase